MLVQLCAVLCCATQNQPTQQLTHVLASNTRTARQSTSTPSGTSSTGRLPRSASSRGFPFDDDDDASLMQGKDTRSLVSSSRWQRSASSPLCTSSLPSPLLSLSLQVLRKRIALAGRQPFSLLFSYERTACTVHLSHNSAARPRHVIHLPFRHIHIYIHLATCLTTCVLVDLLEPAFLPIWGSECFVCYVHVFVAVYMHKMHSSIALDVWWVGDLLPLFFDLVDCC